jgi:hypothetical protein
VNRNMIVIALFLVVMLTGCLREFSTDDPDAMLLIEAIKEYEAVKRQPPKSLDDLIPAYQSTIPEPRNVESIDYHVSESEDAWSVRFVTISGISCTFSSTDKWSCKLPDVPK